jgi:hypothetical protein
VVQAVVDVLMASTTIEEFFWIINVEVPADARVPFVLT